MLHDAQQFFASDSHSIADPARIRNLFKGYQREKVSAAIFVGAIGLVVIGHAVFGAADHGQKVFSLAAGIVCILVSIALIALRQTDPVTFFLKNPAAFVACPATIIEALYVAGNHKGTPPSVRVFAAYHPEGRSPLLVETRFILGSWPFVYARNGELQMTNEKTRRLCRSLPARGWIVYRYDKPQVSFLAGIEA